MRRIVFALIFAIGVLAGTLLPTLSAEQSRLMNLVADNVAMGSKLGLGVAILDGSGNPVTSFGGTGGTSITDDAAFTPGTTAITTVGGIYRSTLDTVDDGDSGALAMLDNRILMAHMVDSSGNPISVGGGTQYTEADTDASITGTALMFEGAANALLAATGDATNGLDVDVTRVSGTVTVSATNLDVQSGGADLLTETTGAAILTSTNFAAAFGTAGTADTQVMSIQGIASMTPVDVSNAALTELAAAINSNLIDVNIVSGAGSGGTALADDGAFTAGTTQGTPAMGFYQSTVTACTDGESCTVGITTGRAMKVALADSAGALLTVASDWTASSAIGSTAPGQMLEAKDFDGAALPQTASAAEGDAIPAAGSLYGISYVMLVGEDGSTQYGTATTPLVVGDGTGALNVIVDSGTVTTVSTVTTLSQFGGNAINLGAGANGTGTLRVTMATDDDVSDAATLFEANLVAHDAVDAGSPLKVGAKAETSLAGVTLVADADRTDLYAGVDGVLIVRPHANLEDRVSAVVGVTDGSSTSLVASQGAGLKFCATTFIVSNSSATNVTVDIRDGTAGSVIATIPAAANMGGAVVPLQVPLCTSDATAMAMDPSAAASTVTVTAVGFKTNL